MWDRFHDDRLLEIREYELLGGLKGAVAVKADAVLGSPGIDAAVIRDAFRRMARVTEDGRYTRGALFRPSSGTARMLRPFVEARLIVEREDGSVEVAHEVLFDSWGTLRVWLDDDREALVLQERVRARPRSGTKQSPARTTFWEGGRLERAVELTEGGRLPVDNVGERFLHSSRERETRRKRELESALRRAEAGYLAQSSALIGHKDPVLALLLARAAIESDKTPETLAQLFQASRLPWIEVTYAAQGACAAISPRGDRIAIAGDETLEIRERGGSSVTTMALCASELAWSPDGARLFVDTYGGDAFLLDADGAVVGRVARSPTGWLHAPKWSPLGDSILAFYQPAPNRDEEGSFDHRVVLWDREGRVSAELRGATTFECACWHPRGDRILTGSVDGTAVVWNTAGKRMLQLDHDHPVQDGAWEPKGVVLATVAGITGWVDNNGARVQARGQLILWNGDGTRLTERIHPSGALCSARWSPDGTRLATAAQDCKVLLWTPGGELANEIPLDYWNTQESWSSDGTNRLLTHNAEDLRIWTRTGEPTLSLPMSGGGTLGACSWLPGGMNGVLMPNGSEGAYEWNCSGGSIASLPHSEVVRAAAWAPDGRRVATACQDAIVRIWSEDGAPLAHLQHDHPVTCLAWRPDAETLAVATEAGEIAIWSRDGTLLSSFSGHAKPVSQLVWSPDGTRLASASSGMAFPAPGTVGDVSIWTPDGQRIASVQEDGAGIESLAWHPSNAFLATIDVDGTLTGEAGRVRFWNRDGSLRATPRGHDQGGWSCRWSPEGEFLATASYDHTARVWNADGKEVLVLQHEDVVLACRWSPCGRRLLTLAQTEERSREVRGSISVVESHVAWTSRTRPRSNGAHAVATSSRCYATAPVVSSIGIFRRSPSSVHIAPRRESPGGVRRMALCSRLQTTAPPPSGRPRLRGSFGWRTVARRANSRRRSEDGTGWTRRRALASKSAPLRQAYRRTLELVGASLGACLGTGGEGCKGERRVQLVPRSWRSWWVPEILNR